MEVSISWAISVQQLLSQQRADASFSGPLIALDVQQMVPTVKAGKQERLKSRT